MIEKYVTLTEVLNELEKIYDEIYTCRRFKKFKDIEVLQKECKPCNHLNYCCCDLVFKSLFDTKL